MTGCGRRSSRHILKGQALFLAQSPELRAEPSPAHDGRTHLAPLRSLPHDSADLLDSALLVVSELVTNAVRYGTEPGDSLLLTLDVDTSRRLVRIEVHDPDRGYPGLKPESVERARGGGC